MSVRFILGRPGTGKTTACMQEVISRLRENPSGPPLIYLVPEHMTFSMEYQFARAVGTGGMTRLNVYSIPRLALRVLQQSGGITRIHLNGTGVAMLLRRIVEQSRGELRLFRKASEQNGFYDVLKDTVTELKRYCLTPERLSAHAKAVDEEHDGDRLLGDKLHDLSLVYQSFEAELEGKYLDSDDYLQLTAGKMKETDFLKQAEVWVDGFQTMTPEEQLVTEELMETAKRTTVIIGADKAYDRPPDEFSPFRHPALLYIQLDAWAEEMQLPSEPLIIKSRVVRTQKRALKHLNLSFGRYPLATCDQTDGIVLTEAVNKREEIEQAARDIIALTRDHTIRYREITVLVRNLDQYADLIETIFGDYGIPIFIDQKKSMRNHPLIELIRSALEVVQQNWRYEPVFRCAKTDLIHPAGIPLSEAREAIDELENYVLAYGIYGRKKWTEKKPWDYRVNRGLKEEPGKMSKEEREAQKRINHLRALIAGPLQGFEQELKSAKNIRDKCKAIYDFLINLMIPDKLEWLARDAEKKGQLEEAKEHGQVWKAVIDMLDQCVEGAGDEPLSLDLFTKIIDTGLDQLEFALVPPALDQVLAGSLDRMRSTELKAVFLLGVNEGVLPAKPSERGLFSDEDRTLLEERGLHVAEGDNGQMSGENELCFRALSLPTERLFLSYPLASEAGESMKASPLIGRIKRRFPGLKVRLSPSEPRALSEENQMQFINAPGKTISYLAAQIREWQKGYGMSDIWWDTYNWYTSRVKWKDTARRRLSGLFSRNEASLSPASARALYGETIQASVSRMERFNACPFSQFASYGLGLREREVFQLDAPDIGQLFHLAVRKMIEEIMSHHMTWNDLSEGDCDKLASETVTRIAPNLQHQILTSSSRYGYLQHKLEQVVARAARVMRRHAQSSGFVPVGLELPFGPGKPLPALTFDLPGGCRMEVVGRIDRIDKATIGDRILLRIIDYKSGLKDLNLSDVYYGLALQMLAYLDVVITYSQKWIGTQAEPAGVLYFHIHNPTLSLDHKLPGDAIEEELYKKFKMKGLLLADEPALLLNDAHAQGGWSQIAPFGLKKNGGYYKGSSVAGKEQFHALRTYTRAVMKDVGQKITGGDVRIAPFKDKSRVPCTYCPFRPVCLFDQSRPGNNYRVLKQLSADRVLEEIKGKETENDDPKA